VVGFLATDPFIRQNTEIVFCQRQQKMCFLIAFSASLPNPF